MFWMHPYYYGGSWGFGLFPILMFVGFILLIWAIFNNRGENEEPTKDEKQESALEILKRRYASGEIDKKEFQEMKKDIG